MPWLIGLAGMAVSVVVAGVLDRSGLDTSTMWWARRVPVPQATWAQRLTVLGEAHWWLVPLAVLGIAAWRAGWRAGWTYALAAFVAVAAAGLSVHPFKWALGRARPKLLFEEGIVGYHWFEGGYGYASMPSGHAAVLGAVAVCLAVAYRPLWPAYVAATGLLAWTRVLTISHYPGDVVVGYTLGAAVAWGVMRAMWPMGHRGIESAPSRS